MTTAYLDTSFLLGMVFEERGAPGLRRRLARYDHVVSSDLLLAEAHASLVRERVDAAVLEPIGDALRLVLPTRSLLPEYRAVLAHGYLRGADLWHLACALFVAGPLVRDVAFLSRDATQRRFAKALGFTTP